MIESYSFGFITINGKTYNSDVIVIPKKVDDSWWRKEGHKVYREDIEEIVKQNPKIMVFGTGEPGLMKVLPETEEYIKSKGIEIITKPSAQALEEYNRLEKEGKKVVGLFHLTC